MNWEVFVLVLYFVTMLSVGMVFFLRFKSKTDKDYFLGGKTMGPWVTAMSAQASDMSAWLLMGLPGSILAFGLGQSWIGIGLAIGTALNWILVARRLRRFSQAAGDAITLPQYLTNRFAAKNKALQISCAVVFLVCFTVYVASAFVAGAKVFTSIFPQIDRQVAMIIFVLILLAYTFLGGFKAVCWTDFVQGSLMLIAVLAIPIVIVLTRDPDYALLGQSITSSSGTTYTFTENFFKASPAEIASGLGWGLGYFGMPHILVRFMAIKKPSMVKKSAIVAITWVVLALFSVILIAVFGRIMIGADLLAQDQQSMVFVELSRKLFPAGVSGILLAALIAASMSTADSQLLVASSSFTSDIYKPIIRKKASDKETLWIGRGVVLLIAAVAFLIASSEGEGAQAIMNLVENAWAGFGSAFGAVIILSLFWRRFTYNGALSGVIVGALVDIFWCIFLKPVTGIYELIPGFALSMVAAVIATLLSRNPDAEVLAIYDAATAPLSEEE